MFGQAGGGTKWCQCLSLQPDQELNQRGRQSSLDPNWDPQRWSPCWWQGEGGESPKSYRYISAASQEGRLTVCSSQPVAKPGSVLNTLPLVPDGRQSPPRWEGRWGPEGEPPANDSETQTPPPGLISSPGAEEPGGAEALVWSTGRQERAVPKTPGLASSIPGKSLGKGGFL